MKLYRVDFRIPLGTSEIDGRILYDYESIKIRAHTLISAVGKASRQLEAAGHEVGGETPAVAYRAELIENNY